MSAWLFWTNYSARRGEGPGREKPSLIYLFFLQRKFENAPSDTPGVSSRLLGEQV